MPIVADLGFGPKRAVGMASVTCRYHVGAQRSVCFGRVNQVLSDCSRGVKWGAKMAQITKSEKLARRRLIYHLWVASEDQPPIREIREEAPDAWHMIEADLDCAAPKQKMTLYLDAPVAKAFKAMGKGYQARINRILGTWMEMKIGHVMEAEKIMLADRRRAILDAEQVEGSETAGRGWGAGREWDEGTGD